MRKTLITFAVAVVAALGAVVGAEAPAHAAVAWGISLYDANGFFVTSVGGHCPSSGRSPVNIPTAHNDQAYFYQTNSYCPLTGFADAGGHGTGVGLTRDGSTHGLGAVAGKLSSVVAYPH